MRLKKQNEKAFIWVVLQFRHGGGEFEKRVLFGFKKTDQYSSGNAREPSLS